MKMNDSTLSTARACALAAALAGACAAAVAAVETTTYVVVSDNLKDPGRQVVQRSDDGWYTVSFIYKNVYGKAPDAATLANLVAPLNAHTTTQAQWMADMALSSTNQASVGLAGYAASGLQFV